MSHKGFPVPGTRVRCAYRMGGEYDHVGVVLALDDVRAWRGSIAFDTDAPCTRAVAAHVAWCLSQGLLRESVPVLYAFGVRWDRELTPIA